MTQTAEWDWIAEVTDDEYDEEMKSDSQPNDPWTVTNIQLQHWHVFGNFQSWLTQFSWHAEKQQTVARMIGDWLWNLKWNLIPWREDLEEVASTIEDYQVDEPMFRLEL